MLPEQELKSFVQKNLDWAKKNQGRATRCYHYRRSFITVVIKFTATTALGSILPEFYPCFCNVQLL